MRSVLFSSLLFLNASVLVAQSDQFVNPSALPAWIYTELTGEPGPKATKSISKPMHTNAFIGTWTLRDKYGRRIHYWGDQHRMIFREMLD
ncbi:MAG: hypothetical protein ACK46C_01305, partial [Flavobacteriales bacterium]